MSVVVAVGMCAVSAYLLPPDHDHVMYSRCALCSLVAQGSPVVMPQHSFLLLMRREPLTTTHA
jgi:hypothetical protein